MATPMPVVPGLPTVRSASECRDAGARTAVVPRSGLPSRVTAGDPCRSGMTGTLRSPHAESPDVPRRYEYSCFRGSAPPVSLRRCGAAPSTLGHSFR